MWKKENKEEVLTRKQNAPGADGFCGDSIERRWRRRLANEKFVCAEFDLEI